MEGWLKATTARKLTVQITRTDRPDGTNSWEREIQLQDSGNAVKIPHAALKEVREHLVTGKEWVEIGQLSKGQITSSCGELRTPVEAPLVRGNFDSDVCTIATTAKSNLKTIMLGFDARDHRVPTQ